MPYGSSMCCVQHSECHPRHFFTLKNWKLFGDPVGGRFNDFVGRIGYLRELEDKYELGYGIHATPLTTDSPIRRNDGSLQPSGVEELYKRVEELVSMPSEQRRKVWAERRKQMLSDKVDCAQFLTWFIENYPASVQETRKATPEFWLKFK